MIICAIITFTRNAKRFAIAFSITTSSLSRQCFWTDRRKLFSYFSPIAAVTEYDQDRS